MSAPPEPAEVKWWRTGVIYQVYPRSFADSNGDGVGDLDGITSRLDYLSETLGVDAFWISPFYPSPQADFGYDVADYCDVDPMYGDLSAFDRLVAAAHLRNLAVIIDFVPNHCSDQHPWFVESRSSLDNPKRNWFTWRPPQPGGSRPNNWLSVFGGPAWTLDQTTGEYYLHSFLPEQPDLNWRNPEVESAMLAAVRFWLERGVDGLRIDVAHFIMKDPELRDQPPAESRRGLPHKPPSEYDTQEHLYDKGHPDIHQVFRKIRSVIDEFEPSSPRYSVGEIHEFDWVKWASYFGDNDELHMPFNFALLLTGLEASAVPDAIADLEAVLPKGAWPNWVMGNHDEPRLATRLGRDQSRAAALLLLTLRGTPTIYYGGELGMLEAVIPPHMVKDPWGHRMPGFSRDGCRTPMQWNAGPNAGFSTAGETWLPVQPSSIINVESELADPGSHLVLYRRLLSIRRAEPSLRAGDITLIEGLPPSCLGYTRHAPGSRPLTVLLNLSGEPVELAWTGQVLASSVPGKPMLGRLRAWEGLILA